MCKQLLTNCDPLLKDREHRFEFVDRGRDRGKFGLLLSPLTVKGGTFRTLLFDLMVEKLTLNCNLRRGCARRRPKAGGGIGVSTEGCAKPCDVQFGACEIALKVFQLCYIHRGVKFDQNVASLDALTIANSDGANNAGFERLYDLGPASWDDLSRRRADNIDMAERCPGQRHAEQRNDSAANRAGK